MPGRLQIALYWGAGCGGCDVAVLDTDTYVLALAEAADVRFWPIAVDGKYADLEAMSDGALDVAIFNGAIRNSENEHVARLLRRKSRLMVAFGTCAWLGGIPGLANLVSRDEILATAYLDNPSIETGNHTVPMPRTTVAAGELTLPVLYRRVFRLADVVAVDYVVPGCPPAPHQVRAVLQAIVEGTLPPPGAVVGAGDRALCDDCPRVKHEKHVARVRRPYEIVANPTDCLLEQGLVCCGPVTRSGCGARCPASGMPCRGCYGPLPGAYDQGAKLVTTVASALEARTPEDIDTAIAAVPDMAGYAYRFSLPASPLERKVAP